MSTFVELLRQLDLVDDDELAWREQAACRGMGPALFFPERGHSAAPAKRVCATCPVWRECLEYALAHHDRLSIAGGLSEKQRREILRRRRLGIPVELRRPRPPACTREDPCDRCRIQLHIEVVA